MTKIVYIAHIIPVTVTVVTVKKMTIMTNDNSFFDTSIDTSKSYVCTFCTPQASGHYTLHCNDPN